MNDALWWRDNGSCARCGVRLSGFYSLHHRKPRGMGGTKDPRSDDPRNLIHLCGSGTTGCHGLIESNRHQGYETGWLLRSLDHLDVPLLAPDGRLITLHANGERVDMVTPESLNAAETFYVGADA
jgi:hypothetical protein